MCKSQLMIGWNTHIFELDELIITFVKKLKQCLKKFL